MSAVSCRDVTRRFSDLTAVDGVSFNVEQNEVFGIIGPNGAGKTTLLNCMEGLDTPTAGSIDVLGLHPVKDAQQLVQRTGVQLQQAALLPRLKVGEALELFSSFYAQPVAWRPLLETLGIAAKEKSYVTRLGTKTNTGRCHNPHNTPSTSDARSAPMRSCMRGSANPRQPGSS